MLLVSKEQQKKPSVPSDLASPSRGATVDSMVVLKGCDSKEACRWYQQSPVPAVRVKLCLQLETALGTK